jgi:hypothetical protein
MFLYTAAIPWDSDDANPTNDMITVIHYLAQRGKTVTEIEYRGRAGRVKIVLGQLPTGIAFKRNDEAESDLIMYAQWEKVASLTVLGS